MVLEFSRSILFHLAHQNTHFSGLKVHIPRLFRMVAFMICEVNVFLMLQLVSDVFSSTPGFLSERFGCEE